MTISPQGSIVMDWRMQLVLFAIALGLSLWLFRTTNSSVRRQADARAWIWQAEIWIEEQAWTIPALLDTGNRLYDPITRTPVMIVEASVLQSELPQSWGAKLQTESADGLLAELDDAARDAFPWLHRLRLVPYRGINGQSRMMLAIKPDRVRFTCAGQSPQQADRVLIGLDGGTLSADGAYRAIIHPELIEMPAAAADSAPSKPA